MQFSRFLRSCVAPTLVGAALSACDTSSLDATVATTTAPDASSVTTTISVTNDQASVDWSVSSSVGAERWRLYQNDLRVCSGEPTSNSSTGTISGECTVTLQEGSNIFYVQLCNLNSSGDSFCDEANAEIIDYQPDEQPGAIYLQDIPSTTSDSEIYIGWIKEEGANGDYWIIYRNNAQACSASLVYTDDFISQSAGCDVTLDGGSNQFYAELCLAKPVGISDICTQSAAISTSFDQDSARILATPVIVDPEESLPAEYNTSITWNKNTSSGSAGEHWSFSSNGIEVCEGTLATSATSASCAVDLQEGDNLLQVQLCTDVETYSGASCASSDILTVAAFDPNPQDPGTLRITNSLLESTYESSLNLQWQAESGGGINSWRVDLNGVEHCSTSNSEIYYTEGTCQLNLDLGANSISVTGCNYGYDDTESCTTSTAVTTELLDLPGTPEITSAFPVTTYEADHELSWERSSGGSGERWLAVVNDIAQCEQEIAAASTQSASCTISLDSGANSVVVRLCVTDSIGTSYCSDSEAEQVELLAPIPAAPVIDTVAQTVTTDFILLEWSKDGGDNGSYWLAYSNDELVDACSNRPITSSGSGQSGSCDLPLVSGANVVSVHLCNDNAAGTSSCAISASVTIERDLVAPEFTSASSASVNENDTSVFYTATATDSDGSADQLSFSLSGADSSFFSLSSSSGSLAFVAPADYEDPQGSNGNSYELTLTVQDDDNLSAQLQLSVEVLNLNDNSPEFAETDLSFSVAENDTSVIHQSSAATDADGDSLTYSLTGADADAFILNSTTLEIAFAGAPDYEQPTDSGFDNTYEVQIQATDGANSALQALTIELSNSDDENPQVTSSSSSSVNLTNATLNTTIYIATASDPDGIDDFTFSLGGSDANHFYLDPSSGELSFTTEPDNASPKDADANNIYELEITVTDPAGNSSSSSLSITVADDVGFAPELDGAESLSVEFSEHSTDLVYDANASDPDGDAVGYSLTGADASLFDLDSVTGELSFQNPPDFEAPFASSTSNVYSVEIIASDGLLTDSQALTVTVVNINEAPYFPESSATNFALSENNTSSFALPTAVDPDGANVNLIYSLPADAGNAHDYQYFNLLTGPAIAFQDPGADYESYSDANNDSIYEFILRASDGSLSADLAFTVTINNVDEAPIFADGNSITKEIEEKSTAVVHTASATDPDQQDSIVYSIAGVDSDSFSFNSTTGELSFAITTDFEYPADANADNIYQVEIIASDSAQSASQDLFVKVTDILDTVPGPPTGLEIYGGDGQVRILWHAQESIDSYTIFQHTDLDQLTTTSYEAIYEGLNSGDETITGLTNGFTYHFIIVAENFIGPGEPSDPVSAEVRLFITACPYPNSATANSSDTSGGGVLDCSCIGTTVNPWLGMDSDVEYSCSGSQRTIVSNSIPDHATGIFPNADNPNAIAAVAASYSYPLDPAFTSDDDVPIQVPGVVRNGVKLEPETGETTTGGGNSQWRYEAINGGVLELGLDDNFAHVQSDGSYHYHGMPEGHMDLTAVNDGSSMILVGWAADGFPIYARYGYADPLSASSGIKVMEGSYELRDLAYLEGLGRPSSDSSRAIDSLPLGTFVEDWVYAAGSGDLDACNGRYGVTPQFPNGIYHYYVTDDYPYIQRCLKGSQELEFTSASEVEVYENTATVYLANATDNLGSSVTYSLNTDNASDNSLFVIGSSSGILSFVDGTFPDNVTFGMNTNVPDYEVLPTGALGNDPYISPYIIEIEAQDDSGGFASIQVQLTILDANESPYFIDGEVEAVLNDTVSLGDDRIANEIAQEANGENIAIFSGISPRPSFIDHEDQLVDHNKPLHDAEITGTDAHHFYIESISSNGDMKIMFYKTPDEDQPEDANGDNIYEFNVVGIDSEGSRNEQPFTLEVYFDNDEYPYLISSSQSVRSDSANDGRLYFETNLSAYSTAAFFTAEGYDEDLFTDLTGATDDFIRNQLPLYFELSGDSPDEQFFAIDSESGELRASKALSYETPEDANGDGVYELQIIVSDRDPYGSQADLDNLLDNTFHPEDVKPRWVYVTVEAITNEATPARASGPQIPWFYSDVSAGDPIKIPWVIYAGEGASSWELYVDDTLICSELAGESSTDVTDRGVCEVDPALLTAGKTDHTTFVRAFYADGSSTDSYPVTFGYAVSQSLNPTGPTSSSKDADDCKDVDIGDPVNASNNADCYNYILSDDDFGGPYDQVPAYLSHDYGRSFEVIAYYTEWAIYSRDVQPADMPVNLLSTALYSFIKFKGDDNTIECEDCEIDGSVDLPDPYASLQKTYDTDEWYDINESWTVTNANDRLGNGIFKQLWLLKQKFPHFKTCLSVGGWTFSRPFPLVASSSSKRNNFVESIVDMAVKYHFDCIDIDWEFPGRAGGDLVTTDPETGEATYDLDGDGVSAFIDPSPADAQYFEYLIQALRDEIVSRPVEASHIEINSAVFTSSDGMALMNYSNFAANLDAIHLMTYDYYGAWDPFTGFQAALYHNSDPVASDTALAGYGGNYNPEHNIASAMTRAVNNAMGANDTGGVFASDLPIAEANAQMRHKIVPGLAFYGRNYSDVGFYSGGNDPVAGKHMVRAFGSENGSTVQIGWEPGNLNYIQVAGYYDDGEQVLGSDDYIADINGDGTEVYSTADYNWTYHWDSESQSPFLFDPQGKNSLGEPTGSFVSYTDPRAIYYQTCHAAWENSKGVMFWEVTQDSADFQLVDAIHAAIRGEDLANRGYEDVPSCSDIIDSDHYEGGSSHVGDSDEPGIEGLVAMGYINEDIFNDLFPHANGDTSTTEQTYTWDGFLEAAKEFTAAGFLDVGSVEDRVRELAAFLANTSHETGNSTGSYALSNIGGATAGSTRYDGGYFYQQEQYCTVGEGTGNSVDCGYCLYGAGYDSACDWINGVDQEAAHYSNYYYGRGPLQLSWNYNYGQFGDYYGTSFLGDPNAVLRDSKTAFASAIWFWMTEQDPKPSMHQVMTDPDYDGDDGYGHAPGFGMTINILNGGLECGSAFSYDKIRNRVGFYLTYLNAFSEFQGSGISPWVNGYGDTPATSLDFPTNDEHLIDDDYPDARDYLSCSQMVNYNDI